MSTQYVCEECKQTFIKPTTLIAHIQRKSECALNVFNIRYLSANNHTSVLLGIHQKYYDMTGRNVSESRALRETRKTLNAVYTAEQRRIDEEHNTAQGSITALQARLEALEQQRIKDCAQIEILQGEKRAMSYIVEEQETIIENRERLLHSEIEKTALATQRCINAMNLLTRINNSMAKPYVYKLKCADLATFKLPSSTCISEATFRNIYKKSVAPEHIISNFTYQLFKVASDVPMIHVKNVRERILFIMTQPSLASNDRVPEQVDNELVDTIVQFILKEIREHTVKYQAMIAAAWNVDIPDHLLTYKLPMSKYTPENEKKLEADRIDIRLLNQVFDYCKGMYVTQHKNPGTQVEAAEIKKTIKSPERVLQIVIASLYRLNMTYVNNIRLSDSKLLV